MAAGDTQLVMLPRQTSARSEAAQFWTWYCVLYVGWTLDFIHPVWSAPSQPHSGFVHQRRRDPASVQRRISPSDGVDRVLGQYDDDIRGRWASN